MSPVCAHLSKPFQHILQRRKSLPRRPIGLVAAEGAHLRTKHRRSCIIYRATFPKPTTPTKQRSPKEGGGRELQLHLPGEFTMRWAQRAWVGKRRSPATPDTCPTCVFLLVASAYLRDGYERATRDDSSLPCDAQHSSACNTSG